jgi:hypothetical protein
MLENTIKKFETQIKTDTLAENIFYNKPKTNYVEAAINGEKLQIEVEKV